MTDAPLKIRFVIDGEEAELIRKAKKADEVHVYRYTKSDFKLGKELPIMLKEIERMKSFKLLEII